MARESEYLTSNRKIRYPFADDTILYDAESSGSSAYLESPGSSESPVPCVIDDTLSSAVFGCFVDALVQVKSPYKDVVPSVTSISVSAHTLSFDIIGGPSDEKAHVKCTLSSVKFPIVRGSTEWCWYLFVLSSDGIREYEEKAEELGDIRENRLLLSSRCLGASAPSVSDIWVYGGEQPDPKARYTLSEALAHDPDVKVSGDVSFCTGYNMTFGSEDGGFSINAKPGAGAGYAPCGCTPSGTTFAMPELLAQDGHVRLFNDTCYDLVPSKYSNAEGTLSLHVKCKACCTCEMYADLVNKRLIPLRDKIVESKASLAGTLATYEENVTKWNARIATALPEDVIITTMAIALEAAATKLSTAAKVKGKMDRCGYSVTMRNDSFVNMRFDLDSFMSNGKPFEATLGYMRTPEEPKRIPVDLSVTASPIFSVTLSPGRSAVLTYYLRLDKMVKTEHKTGFVSRIRISAYQGTHKIVTRYEEIGV